MSSTPTPILVGRGEAADVSAAQRLNEWRTRLDAFADAFNAEISQILTTLADLPLEAPRTMPFEAVRDVPAAPVGGRTMEFTLPPAAPAAAPQPVAAVRAPVSVPTQTSRPAASAAPVATPAVTAPRPASSAPAQPAAASTEPNRLAALKARLSQQMASAGQSQPAPACSSEGSRS